MRVGNMLQALSAILIAGVSRPATATTFGPFNVDFPAGGDGLARDLPAGDWHVGGGSAWSMRGWIKVRSLSSRPSPIAVLAGDGGEISLTLTDAALILADKSTTISARAILARGWHHIGVLSDGARISLYVDGRLSAAGTPGRQFTPSTLTLAPRGLAGASPFDGWLAGFAVTDSAFDRAEVIAAATPPPDPDLITFASGSPIWPVQRTNMPGITTPQDPWTLPKSAALPGKPIAIPAYDGAALVADGANSWTLPKWRLHAADTLAAGGSALSDAAYGDGDWYRATVPGTVLTTLVDRGVYPDPAFGLNNVAIPENLGRRPWWYRTTFDAPAALPRHASLEFGGINYAAEVWLNGEQLGEIHGAFMRGVFDVTGKLRPRGNALAVRILPPRHPGLAHEQSLTAGWGPNGGMQALDGPTFFASEGWDWIPGVRDRNVGLWQPVMLRGSDDLRIEDAQIVTTLPRSDNTEADIEISVPIRNLSANAQTANVAVTFDDVSVAKTVEAGPGVSVVHFTPAEFPKLAVMNPRLWWPNGYGPPDLHTAHVAVTRQGGTSDVQDVRFGMRQMTYELSLMAPSGDVRRVEVNFAKARQLEQQVVDVRHEGIRKVPGGWVESLTAAGAASPAVTQLADTKLAPFLVIRVNGVRIAARGGSWGTDDFMKRSSRDRLEPYFRLHRDAGVNIIRNWVGQNTESTFYDLADEYGLLVINDFWASTQDYQEEPEDVPLFLANAGDVIKRYRNHPSIALWFGRNEGVPQPVLNEGLEQLVRTLDGTRWYSGSSNSINLWFSGPYNYREPESYFTTHGKGFAVEIGTPSFPTLEAFEAVVPPSERWPISDTWAYHDWHQNGNGETKSFMAAMAAKYSAPTGLTDFERKAQLMNYDDYRAIMEGMNAELWRKTSGRMLWMTQSAWPSTMWQIISHDYDTHAAFYAFKHAAEPVHVQLTLPDHKLQLVNNRLARLDGARIGARVIALDGRDIDRQQRTIDVAAGQVADGAPLDLDAILAREGAVIVALEASDAGGAPLSHNVYWLARDDDTARKLNAMAPQRIAISAAVAGTHVSVIVHNDGKAPALNVKLTLLAADGNRVLPAYYADNYLSLLGGETRAVRIDFDGAKAIPTAVAVRGWNVVPTRARLMKGARQ